MSLETRAREAAESLRNTTLVDAEDGLARLHRTQQRRTASKVVAVLALVAAGAGLVQFQTGDDDAAPTDRYDGPPVLISASGGDWEDPVTGADTQSYPTFVEADPVTGRFLVEDIWNFQYWTVFSPGSRTELAIYPCTNGCKQTVLGPGEDEITTVDPGGVVVLGPGGQVRRHIEGVWTPPPGKAFGGGNGSEPRWTMAWAPDGETLAVARESRDGTEASVEVVLHDPETGDEVSVYEISETAPPSHDHDAFGWGSPTVQSLAWSRDSSRLAFALVSYSSTTNHTVRYDRQLVVADLDSGEVEEIADLSGCRGSDRFGAPSCFERTWVAWSPDGESLSVLAETTFGKAAPLRTFDVTGRELDHDETTMYGPLVWLGSE